MDEYDNPNDSSVWNFDIFKYHEALGEDVLTHFGMRMFMKYGLIDKFSISE